MSADSTTTESPILKPSWRIPPSLPILVAIVLGVLIRVAWLNAKPLWEDEAWTFVTAISDRPLVDIAGADPHPMSFYFVIRQLPRWFLSSDWAFRLPHAIASCAALLLIPFVFRRLLSPDRGMGVPARDPRVDDRSFARTQPETLDNSSIDRLVAWCTLVFSLLPLNVRYAQDARAYAFCQLAGVIVLLLYLKCRQNRSWASIGGLVIATSISMHIDGFGWITPTICGLHGLLSVRTSDARRAIAALVAGGLSAIPYVYFRMTHMMAAGEMHTVGSGRLGRAFAARWLELSPIGVAFDPVPAKYAGAIWFVAAVAALVYVIGMTTSVWRKGDQRRWLAILLFVVPFAGLTTLSLYTGEIYIFKKYLIPTAPAVVLLFTLGLLRVTRGSFLCAMLVLCVVPLGVSAVSNVRAGDRADWRSLYDGIRPRIQANDAFAQERHLNYPGYSFGPLCAYAWRDRIRLDDAQLHEYTDAADSASSIRAFMDTRGGDRIWTITTNWMARDRMADLSAMADRITEVRARGCRATLWRLRSSARASSGER